MVNIILIDIESSPLHGLSWDTYKTTILKIIEPSKIISCAWKKLEEKKTYCKAICDYKGYKAGVINDEALVKDIWKVLDDADIVIGQNSDAFDLKKLNARFAYYGLNAPSKYETVDTLKVAKKYFRFDSNRLNNLAQYLEVGKKSATGGLDLWLECIEGNKDAWAKMKSYNINDVVILEQVYLRLRPFIDRHPNVGLIEGRQDTVCGTCMSDQLQKRGFSYTLAGRKQRYLCTNCGSWSTGPYERFKHDSE